MRGPEGRKGRGRGGLESAKTKRRLREDSGGVVQCADGDQGVDCGTEERGGDREEGWALGAACGSVGGGRI